MQTWHTTFIALLTENKSCDAGYKPIGFRGKTLENVALYIHKHTFLVYYLFSLF
mgnify:CR=1 FL=1